MSARCVKLIQSTFKPPIFIYLWLWCCRVLLNIQTRTRYSHIFFFFLNLIAEMSSSCMQSCGPVVFLFVKHIRFSPHCTLIELLSDKRAPICNSRACTPPGWHSSRTAWWEISWVNVFQYVEPLYLLWLRVRQQTNFLLTRGEYIRLSSALVSRCSSFITVDNQATVIKSFGEMAP